MADQNKADTFSGELDADLSKKVLGDAQLELWSSLNQIPDDFILYGGTAIALRLGHRKSIDFLPDLYGTTYINPQKGICAWNLRAHQR